LLKYFYNKAKQPIFAIILKYFSFFLSIITRNRPIKQKPQQQKDKKYFKTHAKNLDNLLNQFKN